MIRTIEAAEADGFVEATMDAALARVKSTALETLAAVGDWERFREVLESLWPWTVADGSPGRRRGMR